MNRIVYQACGAFLALLAGFLLGWQVSAWQEGEKAQQGRAERAEAALSSRIQTETAVNDAARAAGVIAGQASQKMEKVKNGLKELPALPAACRPDDSRAGRLRDAISAAAGYRSGQTVRDAAVP